MNRIPVVVSHTATTAPATFYCYITTLALLKSLLNQTFLDLLQIWLTSQKSSHRVKILQNASISIKRLLSLIDSRVIKHIIGEMTSYIISADL